MWVFNSTKKLGNDILSSYRIKAAGTFTLGYSGVFTKMEAVNASGSIKTLLQFGKDKPGWNHSNVKFRPANQSEFMYALLQCSGVITGGGFETVAEALYLNKRVLTIPIKGQYEQECNAIAANGIHNGYKGTLFTEDLLWFLDRTTHQINEYEFKISTDEQVLEAIENVLYDQV